MENSAFTGKVCINSVKFGICYNGNAFSIITSPRGKQKIWMDGLLLCSSYIINSNYNNYIE